MIPMHVQNLTINKTINQNSKSSNVNSPAAARTLPQQSVCYKWNVLKVDKASARK